MLACEFLPSTLGSARRKLFGAQSKVMTRRRASHSWSPVSILAPLKGASFLEASTGGFRKESQFLLRSP